MNGKIWFSLLMCIVTLCCTTGVYSQSAGVKVISDFDRFLISPYAFPYINLDNVVISSQDNVQYRTSSTGFDAGVRMQTAAIKKWIGLGVDLGGAHRYINYISLNDDINFNGTSIDALITPFLWLKSGKHNKKTKFELDLGLSIRRLIRHNIRYASTGVGRRLIINPNFIDRTQIYGFAGISLVRKRIPFGFTNTKLSSLSVGVYLPFFDQIERFSGNPKDYISSFEHLAGSRNKEVYLGLQMNQMIDFSRSSHQITPEAKAHLSKRFTRQSALLPPIVNAVPSHRRVEGAINVGVTYQPAIDSIDVNLNEGIGYLHPSANWTAGYTLHFLSTHRTRYARNPEGQISDMEFVFSPAITMNLFAGARVTRGFQRIDVGRDYIHLENWTFSAEGGIRIGHPMIYLTAGGGLSQRTNNVVRTSTGVLDSEFNFSQPEREVYFFAGFQVIHSVMARVNYSPDYTFEAVPKSFAEKLSFTFTLGF